MANIKELKNRIKSVKSTQKITKAMKMVAAAKLRKARIQAENAEAYAQKMRQLVNNLTPNIDNVDNKNLILSGTGKEEVHLLIVASSNRGLCGSFNSSIVKACKKKVNLLLAENKKIKIFCIGKKGYEQLKSHYSQYIIGRADGVSKQNIEFEFADEIANKILADYDLGSFDICTVIYNKFKSAISHEVTLQQLIPLVAENEVQESSYEFEPNQIEILDDLLPLNFAVQIFYALIENAASEQGARMTAMDNASKNASEMIKDLGILYNRTRQAVITKELIEIISGAQAI